jgi:hypothetical protein
VRVRRADASARTLDNGPIPGDRGGVRVWGMRPELHQILIRPHHFALFVMTLAVLAILAALATG